jgi:VanZ family protein
MKKIISQLRKRWVSVTWTLIIFILLALPGSVIPKEEGFSIPEFDKFVHVILFGGFVFLWSYYYSRKGLPARKLLRIFFGIFLIACAYGIGMEYVQKYFIPMRDFSEGDIIADILGAGIGYGICTIRLLNI